MAILKSKAARDLPADELTKKRDELSLELMKERGKIRVGGVPENPGKLREMKRTVARIITIQAQKAGVKKTAASEQTQAKSLK